MGVYNVMKDYSKNLVKEYKYWNVNIHENQVYLGRLVIWCKREDATDLTEVTKEEYEELLIIIKELKAASTKVFNPDWFNYDFLGNIVRHLHCHFLPRYSSERVFEGVTFKDDRWGDNYQTDLRFKIPEEVFEKIKSSMKESLN